MRDPFQPSLSPRTYLATFLASVVLSAVVLCAVANSIPGRIGAYIPMREGHDFIRDEFVRQNAMRETPSPCVAVFGDSRAAFNVSAAAIDKALPPGCGAQNFAFASLSLAHIDSLLSDLTTAPDIAIVSVSEILLSPYNLDLTGRLLRNHVARWFYLGHQRLLYLWMALSRRRPPDSHALWTWSSAEKRWQYNALETRVFIETPTYEQAARDIAINYFATREGDASLLAPFLARAATKTKHLIVIIPPSETRFQQLAEEHGHGKQRAWWRLIEKSARDVGATFINCASGCVDQSGFGDPVHLNGAGARQYSQEIAARFTRSRPRQTQSGDRLLFFRAAAGFCQQLRKDGGLKEAYVIRVTASLCSE